MTTTHDIRTGLADVGDAKLKYWDRGEGETILLAHAGVFGDWFAPLFGEPALDGFRVIRVHRAGYGGSSTPDGYLTLADHARQCSALLRGLAVDRAYWVGHSSSGSIGLQAALDEPGLFAGLVLLEPAPSPSGPSSADLFARVIGPAIAAVEAGDIPAAADIFLRGVAGEGYRDDIRARLGASALDQLNRDARFFFTNEIRAAVEWPIDSAVAARITTPTLLVHGGEGWRQTRAHAETSALLAQMLPAAETVELPGVGHGMPLQDPAAIARLIARTLERWTHHPVGC